MHAAPRPRVHAACAHTSVAVRSSSTKPSTNCEDNRGEGEVRYGHSSGVYTVSCAAAGRGVHVLAPSGRAACRASEAPRASGPKFSAGACTTPLRCAQRQLLRGGESAPILCCSAYAVLGGPPAPAPAPPPPPPPAAAPPSGRGVNAGRLRWGGSRFFRPSWLRTRTTRW